MSNNFLSDEKQDALFEILIEGGSIRGAAREVGVSPTTVLAYRKAYFPPDYEDQIKPCPCGRAAGHRGWCSVRFERSPRRQATMAAMHERQGVAPSRDILDLRHLPTPGWF